MATINTLSHQKITGISQSVRHSMWALTHDTLKLRKKVAQIEKRLVKVFEKKGETNFREKITFGLAQNESFLFPHRKTYEKDYPVLAQGERPIDWPNVPTEIIDEYLNVSADIQINILTAKVGYELLMINKGNNNENN